MSAADRVPNLGADSGADPEPDLDPVAWTLRRYDLAPLHMTFRATTEADALGWQLELRAKLTELLGGFPAQRTPLDAIRLDVREFPTYRREEIAFTSRPGVRVVGYLLTPTNVPRPLATVICIPGHGRGVDDIVGIDAEGADRATRDGYQADFAIQAAEHGLAALAIEPMAFGRRRDPAARSRGPEATSCEPAAGAALLLGETMIGWRVWDVMRAIDYIDARHRLH